MQPSLWDEQNLATITDAKDFPGERLIVCRNPLVAAKRARTREELLGATETDLVEIANRVANGTLTGADQIGLVVGPAVKRYRVRKHFQLQITDTTFTYERKREQIDAEAALDGFYILRTSLATETLAEGDVVRAYKNLEQTERAFGSFKGPDLQIRPIHHHLEDRVRAHVLICMLAYYLTWHLKAVEVVGVHRRAPAHQPRPGRQRARHDVDTTKKPRHPQNLGATPDYGMSTGGNFGLGRSSPGEGQR